MFEHYTNAPSRPLLGSVALSLVIHAAFLVALLWQSHGRSASRFEKAIQIVFRQPLPPPPPPLASAPAPRKSISRPPVPPTEPRQTRRIEPPAPREPADPPVDDDERQPEAPAEGVSGGVVGGVVGGVAGGVPSHSLGTGTPKPKNVPHFVIQRDVIAQPKPKLSEVFKQTHRNSGPVTGVYKVCVGTNGRAYEVTAIQSVPGADEDIIETIREGWLYKPQQVPVCFLYNIPITVR
jgi:protein TonB